MLISHNFLICWFANLTNFIAKGINKEITEEDLKELQDQVKFIESEKATEEKRLNSEIAKNEKKISTLKHEHDLVTLQVKEKDQEFRINELKIRELKRQLPQKIRKMLEEKEKEIMSK